MQVAWTVPIKVKLTKVVRDLSNVRPPSLAELLIKSLRCRGHRPSGPAAEPLGKERIALETSSSEIKSCKLKICRCAVWHGGVKDEHLGVHSLGCTK